MFARLFCGLLFLLFIATIGCAPIDDPISEDDTGYEAQDYDDEFVPDPETFEPVLTRYYYINNPTTSGGCSNALRLTATGTNLTRIIPSGCTVNGTGATAHPSWTTLTSAGAISLSDTWYDRQYDQFDHAATSANWYAWCGSGNTVTVRVTGTTVTRLTYWFTDDTRCVF
jgi:hypothetical protein